MVNAAARRSFETLVAAAFVDGDLDAREREVLHRQATDLGIPAGLFRELLDKGRAGKLACHIPQDPVTKAALLDHLIDLAVADTRIEGPEHHLLAKFAQQLGMKLPELRQRIRERLDRRPAKPRKIEPKDEVIEVIDDAAPELHRRTAEPLAPPSPPEGAVSLPPGPVTLDGPRLGGAEDVAGLPPVTLGLIKQTILIESPADAVRYVERLLGLTRPEAEEVVAKVRSAFPDLKPSSLPVRPRA